MKILILIFGAIMFSSSASAVELESFHELTAKRLLGDEESFSKYKGKVVLVVNVASKCGFTPQYKGLQELYSKYESKGLVVMGFPCNQFGSQEPGSEKEINEFCQLNYAVTFPMFEKVDVNGSETHPVYQYLKTNSKGFLTSDIKWNFTKFLIDQDGKVIERFGPSTKPEEIASKIEELL